MDLLTHQDARLLGWLAQRLKIEMSPQACKWVAGLDAGGIVWVAAYSHFSSAACELTIATDGSKRWASRRALRLIFGIPFMQWKMRRVSGLVRANNSEAIDMAERLGGTLEGRARCAFDGDIDGLIYGMLREECRWV